jgi:TonB family protein
MKNNNNKEQLIKNAFYEGGKKAMDEFVQKNIKYPAAALEHKIEGKVHLFLDIDKAGKVIKVKVVSGIGHGCDEEAIRVVKMMEWKVDKIRNMHVVFHQKLMISFKIPPQKEPTINLEDVEIKQPTIVSQSISYVYVENTPAVKQEEKKIDFPAPVTYVYSL